MRGRGATASTPRHRAVHPRRVLRVRRRPTSTSRAPRLGERRAARTDAGQPALDLAAGVAPSLDACGVELVPSPCGRVHRVHARLLVATGPGAIASARRWSSGSRAVTDRLARPRRAAPRPHRERRRRPRARHARRGHQGLRPRRRSRRARAAGLVDLGENYAQELRGQGRRRSTRRSERPCAGTSSAGCSEQGAAARPGRHAVAVGRPASSSASEIAKRAPGAAVLVQVNTSRRAAEGRLRARRRPAARRGAAASSASIVRGLMGVGPAGRRREPHRVPTSATLADDLDLPRAVDGHDRRPRGRGGGGLDDGPRRHGAVRAASRVAAARRK